MPNLDEFLNKKNEKEEHLLEKLSGLRSCKTCDEDVNGATWDPIKLLMSWKCSKGHETTFKVN